MAEERMNLAALQQRDPYISEIVDTASQVAVYLFNTKTNAWEKLSISGSLFFYKRSASPENGFMILNRLGLNNLVEPITKYLDFHRHDSFLLYRNTKEKVIYGVWFYDEEECKRIDKQLTRYVKAVMEEEEKKAPSASGSASEPRKELSILSGPGPGGQVDIMQMLSKAQHEYNIQGTGDVKKKTEPKPMIDNPNASATKKTNLIRPMPLKMPDTDQIEEEGAIAGSATPGTATISLDALFRTASLQQEPRNLLGRQTSVTAGSNSQPEMKSSQEDLPPLLRQIMSTGSMVEDIERPYVDTTESKNKSDVSLSTGSLPVGLPDVTQPPPGHPAYRGPSPREQQQRSPRSGGSGNTSAECGAKSKSGDDRDISSSDGAPVKFSLTNQGVSPQIISGNLLPQIFNLPTSQSSQLNTQEGNVQTLSTAQERVSPRETTEKSETLLTPADLLQSSVSVASVSNVPSLSSKALNTSLASAVGSTLSTDLLTPMAFLTAKRASPTTLQDTLPKEEPSKSSDPLPVAPLTKEQLKQAMLYLIKNDSGFVSSLHEAYLKSLQELSGHKT